MSISAINLNLQLQSWLQDLYVVMTTFASALMATLVLIISHQIQVNKLSMVCY